MKEKLTVKRDADYFPREITLQRGRRKLKIKQTPSPKGEIYTLEIEGRRDLLPSFTDLLAIANSRRLDRIGTIDEITLVDTIQTVGDVEALLAIAAEDVEFIDLDSATTVKPGTTESINVKPPADYIYELLICKIEVGVVPASTSGNHIFQVKSETEHIDAWYAKSDHATIITCTHGVILTADLDKRPTGEPAQEAVMRGLRIDENNGVDIHYTNNADTDQTNARTMKLWVRKIKVA